MPVGPGLANAPAVFPGPLGGERKDGERNAVPSSSALGISSEKAHEIDAILLQSEILRFLLSFLAGHPRASGFCFATSQHTRTGTRRARFW